MPTLREVKESIGFANRLLELIQANQEIAVMRIEALRRAVVRARALAGGLAEVYGEVYWAHKKSLSAKERIKKSGSALVLLSTNQRLAGPITAITSRHFMKLVAASEDDIVIVGKIGYDRFKSKFPSREATFFDTPTGESSITDLGPLFSRLHLYENLTVVYPRFENLVSQKPVVRKIGTAVVDEIAASSVVANIKSQQKYIFEPSLSEVFRFFDGELFSLVMQQYISELDLALVGSRITSLEKATVSIAANIHAMSRRGERQQRRKRNNEQLERLAGRSLWAV